MDSLPNELRQNILLDIPPSEIIETCNSAEVFSSACDWNFWRLKAQKDFKISASYFDLPLSTPEGPGSFDEIPFVKGELFREEIKFSERRSKLGEGGFRYCQIASRISLLPQFMANKNRKIVPGFIEPAAFFVRAKYKEQDELIPFLLQEIPTHLLASIYGRNFPLQKFFEFQLDTSILDHIDSIGFEFLLLENLLHPNLFGEMVKIFDDGFPIFKFISQIRKGETSKELETFFEHPNPMREFRCRLFTTMDYILSKKGHCSLLDKAIEAISKTRQNRVVDWLTKKAFQTADFVLFDKVMKDEERKRIFECSNYGNIFSSVAYFGANEKMIQIAIGNDKIDGEYLASGYSKNSRPEDYFNIFQKIKRFTPELIGRIFSLGDCDILSICLRAQKPLYDDEIPLETTVKFFFQYIEYGLGYLDVIAWIIRVFKKCCEGVGTLQIATIVRPLLRHRIFSPCVPLLQEHNYVSPIEKLADKMTISKLMLYNYLSGLCQNHTPYRNNDQFTRIPTLSYSD